MEQQEPSEILALAFEEASRNMDGSFVSDTDIASRIKLVCRCLGNRSGTRLLLACALAKVHGPNVDIRKPYTEIEESGTYSGRSYDEGHVAEFIIKHSLPCNPTTAFLTPGFRNLNRTLTPGVEFTGRPRDMYESAIQLLDDVQAGRITARDLLNETVRCLLNLREERRRLIESKIADLHQLKSQLSLSSEDIVSLIEQHLACPRAARLPVLVVAAAYEAASELLGERRLPLYSHTAADQQTGALGDIEITLIDDNNVITSYEMKDKRVSKEDINRALQKVTSSNWQVDNYIFITTDIIEEGVSSYAASLYRETGGTEFAVLDCSGFLRHFLHFFHRLRFRFLDAYQELLLAEPESAVAHALKEAFLSLRIAAESAYCEE